MKMFKLSEAPSIPPREYLIEGLIYKGEISLLYGPSSSGKSAIIEDMFTRAAAGLAVSYAGKRVGCVLVCYRKPA